MSKTTRLLSLILVIALALSLFTFGASAATGVAADDYNDYANVNYQTAVDVLTYIGVFNGIADGDETAFKPEGTLQRDMAAAIVSRLFTGVKADELARVNTVFTDVTSAHWASGNIQWGAKNGIIDGVGKGLYNPTGEVTVLQFLKLVLAGLGYGANGEFVGAGWDTNVYVKATELGLWGGITPILEDRPATREEAAEIAYEGLKQSQVTGADIVVAGLSGDKYVEINDGAPIYHTVHGLGINEVVDDIGYLWYNWVDGSYVIASYAGTPDAVFYITSSTTANDIYKGFANIEVDPGCFWVNGYDGFYTKSGRTLLNIEDIAGYSKFFIGADGKVRHELAGAKVTIYSEGDVKASHIDWEGTHKKNLYSGNSNIGHVVVEIQFAAEVTAVNSKKGTYTAEIANTYTATMEIGGVTYYYYPQYGNDYDDWSGYSYVPDGIFSEAGLVFTGLDNAAGYAKGDIITVVPKFKAATLTDLRKIEWDVEEEESYKGELNQALAATSKVLKTAATSAVFGAEGYTSYDPVVWQFADGKVDGASTWNYTNAYVDALYYETGTSALGLASATWYNYEWTYFYIDEYGFIVYSELFDFSILSTLPDAYYLTPIAADLNNLDRNLYAGNYKISALKATGVSLVGDFDLYGYGANLQKVKFSEQINVIGSNGLAKGTYGTPTDYDEDNYFGGTEPWYGHIAPKKNTYWDSSDYSLPAHLRMVGGSNVTDDDDTNDSYALAYGTYSEDWYIKDSLRTDPIVSITTFDAYGSEVTNKYVLGENALLAINDVIYSEADFIGELEILDDDNTADSYSNEAGAYFYFSYDEDGDAYVNAIWIIELDS